GVLVHRRVEEPIASSQYDSESRQVFRNPKTRRYVVLVGIHKPSGVAVFAADEHGRHAVVEDQVAVRFTEIIERTGVLISHTEINRRGRSDLPAILREAVI